MLCVLTWLMCDCALAAADNAALSREQLDYMLNATSGPLELYGTNFSYNAVVDIPMSAIVLVPTEAAWRSHARAFGLPNPFRNFSANGSEPAGGPEAPEGFYEQVRQAGPALRC